MELLALQEYEELEIRVTSTELQWFLLFYSRDIVELSKVPYNIKEDTKYYFVDYKFTSLVAQMVRNLPAMGGNLGLIPGLERSSGEKNNVPSRITWRIPWTEEDGRLQSMELQRVRQTGRLSLSVTKYLGKKSVNWEMSVRFVLQIMDKSEIWTTHFWTRWLTGITACEWRGGQHKRIPKPKGWVFPLFSCFMPFNKLLSNFSQI